MAIIVIGGSNRGVGKTALVCGVIAALPDFSWTAIKITSHDHGQRKPIWEETVAGEDTDTARYLAAGAHRALLATPPLHSHTPEPDLPPLLDELWPMFGPGSNLIFESNSVVHHVSANLCLLIHGWSPRALPLPERKPSFTAAVRFADAMVTHCDCDGVSSEELCLAGQEPKPIFHLRALEHVSGEMLSWMRARLPVAVRR